MKFQAEKKNDKPKDSPSPSYRLEILNNLNHFGFVVAVVLVVVVDIVVVS